MKESVNLFYSKLINPNGSSFLAFLKMLCE